MMLSMDTTIAAIATARGQASVAVIRLSGKDAWDIAGTIFSRKKSQFKPGRFYHGWITDDGHIVDEVLLLVSKGPNSYTGEDVIEIQCHGGDAISHKILNLCADLRGNRGGFGIRRYPSLHYACRSVVASSAPTFRHHD